MRYFFDTEFNENVSPIQLISIGIVAEDGRELYLIHNHYSLDDGPHVRSCNDWVKKHVIPILRTEGTNPRAEFDDAIRTAVRDFVTDGTVPEFWAYYGDHDWVLLTGLFKSFDRLPPTWPKVCYDLHQFARHYGLHRSLPQKFQPAHNALVDARWTKHAFESVMEARASAKGPLWP